MASIAELLQKEFEDNQIDNTVPTASEILQNLQTSSQQEQKSSIAKEAEEFANLIEKLASVDTLANVTSDEDLYQGLASAGQLGSFGQFSGGITLPGIKQKVAEAIEDSYNLILQKEANSSSDESSLESAAFIQGIFDSLNK